MNVAELRDALGTTGSAEYMVMACYSNGSNAYPISAAHVVYWRGWSQRSLLSAASPTYVMLVGDGRPVGEDLDAAGLLRLLAEVDPAAEIYLTWDLDASVDEDVRPVANATGWPLLEVNVGTGMFFLQCNGPGPNEGEVVLYAADPDGD